MLKPGIFCQIFSGYYQDGKIGFNRIQLPLLVNLMIHLPRIGDRTLLPGRVWTNLRSVRVLKIASGPRNWASLGRTLLRNEMLGAGKFEAAGDVGNPKFMHKKRYEETKSKHI